MPKQKHSEIVAGIAVILGIAVTLGVVLWLGAANMLKTRGQLVSFYVPQSYGSVGLLEGSEVALCDGTIGRVSQIEVQPDKKRCIYRIRLQRRDVEIYSDGKATVVSPPIGTAKLVVVDFGSSGQLADDDHPILLSGGLDAAMGDIAKAVANVKDITETLKDELGTTQPHALLTKVHAIIDKLTSAAADMAGIAANINAETDKKNADSILAKVDRAAGDINEITADAKPRLQGILTSAQNTAGQIEQYSKRDIAEILLSLRESGTEILKITRSFSDAAEQAKEIVVFNRESIDEMIDNMTQVSANLKSTSKEIRRNPWKLLYKPDDRQLHSQNIYDAARAFSSGASELDQAVTKLSRLAKARPEGISPDDPLLQSVRRKLQNTFKNFSKAEQALWKELEK